MANPPVDYWKAVVEYYSQSESLKVWMESPEGAALKDFEEDTLKQIISAFSYQGFDPLKIIAAMRVNYQKYITTEPQETIKISYVENNVTKELVYDNHQTMKYDIQLLLLIFAQRGSTWSKITGKALPGVEEIMEIMREKYNLDSNVNPSNTSLGPNVITIPRVAGCFPSLMVNAYHRNAGKLLVTLVDIGLPEGTSKGILTPFYASCIPPEWINKNMNSHLLFFLVHVFVDEVIHKKTQDFTGMAQMLTYYKAAYASPAFPVRVRAIFNRSISLSNAAGNGYSDHIITATGAAELAIRDMRPRDPDLNAVISELKQLKTPGA